MIVPIWSALQHRPATDSPGEGDQSYLASVSDLMIGVLFMFMLVLAILALRFRAVETQIAQAQETREGCSQAVMVVQRVAGGKDVGPCPVGAVVAMAGNQAATIDTLQAAGDRMRGRVEQLEQERDSAVRDRDAIARGVAERQGYRAAFLQRVKSKLSALGVTVDIDTGAGLLRLGNAVNFDTGQPNLAEASLSHRNVDLIAKVLMEELPCYTWNQVTCTKRTEPTAGVIDAMFIEGHTDRQPIAPGKGFADNYALSTARAWTIYNQMKASQPELGKLTNKCEQSVMSLSGYGPDRPVEKDKDISEMNRRIDIRFLLAAPVLPGQADHDCGGKAR